MFGYRKLLQANSKINHDILVYSFFGQPRMEIGGLLQSGGIIRGIWKKAVKKVESIRILEFESFRKKNIPPGFKTPNTPGVKIQKVLILGLGAGTAAEEISKTWPEAKIIGIEIDPQVVAIGRKYFKLSQFEKSGNLKIVIGDAIKFITKILRECPFGNSRGVKIRTLPECIKAKGLPRSENEEYDLIIVDLYMGKDFVDPVWQKPFLLKLKQLLKPPIHYRLEQTDRGSDHKKTGGIVVFNHLFWGEYKKKAEEFVRLGSTVFPKISLCRTLANLLIFAS